MTKQAEQPVYVYFVDQRAHVKIGISKDPKRRLQELQTGNPNPLHLLGAFRCPDEETARRIEQIFHEMFEPVLIGGEWFDLSGIVYPHRSYELWLHHLEKWIIALEILTAKWHHVAKQNLTAQRRGNDKPLYTRGGNGHEDHHRIK